MQNIAALISFLMLVNFADGLEVNLTKEYYDIAPANVGMIRLAMMEASHLSESTDDNHTVGGYEASAMISRMNLVYDNGQCKAKIFEMELNGIMTLPRLKMGNYPLKIRQTFEDEQIALEKHENVHAEIWQSSLKGFEEKVRGMIVQDNENCDRLINEINQEMAKVLDEILYRNLEFDCISYGDQLKLSQCH
ncbi:DUF922 domain-containing protein [Wohlfahrtiimonas populi]|uniref:DUF922 domain-containing protein n=1 Tax=Wohlfahrtiimonas populi TaxID=1940240 RepID=UPI00098D64DC|nr:DUF922 domain-containing protein [Wohlfahrtiimonas populi]